VTASEIVDFIQILDLKKASGPDKISHKMLKIAPEKIAEQNKKQLNSFFSSELSIELYSSNNWWIVECFGRKPD
jgi:hypothetical protein